MIELHTRAYWIAHDKLHQSHKMIVYYKFENSPNCNKVYFDGTHISVASLKVKIIQQSELSEQQNFDLKIVNAKTKDGKCLRRIQIELKHFYCVRICDFLL